MVKKDLLRNPTGEYPQISARVAAWKIITTTKFQVRFLNQSRPEGFR
jgi:hypothetical protein